MKGLPVLVGYDGSTSSRKALDWAVQEATARHVPLKVLYADPVPLPLNPSEVQYSAEILDAVRMADSDVLDEVIASVKESAPGLEVDGVLSTLLVTEALIEHGRTAEMVVVGRRGAGGLGGLVVGSKALQVATHGSCPTVVVPLDEAAPEYAAVHTPEQGRVVVGVESADASAAAISVAFDEAALRGVGLTAVHAWEAPWPLSRPTAEIAKATTPSNARLRSRTSR